MFRRFAIPFLVASLAAGVSAQYNANGVRLLSQIPLNKFPGSPSEGSAIYGYTAPSGREYAVIGLKNGTAIVDITNPTAPVVINHIPGPSSSWHEQTVLNGYAYAISDGNNAIGIQIIDLRNADNGVAPLVSVYNGASVGKEISNVHTIQADPQTKRLFANGSNRGFVIFDASNPTTLVELGRWTQKYVHDCFVKNYTEGPYAGKQITFLFCGQDGLYIADTTNPANITIIGQTKIYSGSSSNTYCHSGSLSPDGKYMLVNDEFDEFRGNTTSATTIAINIENLTAPFKAGAYKSGLNVIDHNSHQREGFLFLSSYKAGLRILDVKDPLSIKEVGFLDTYPGTDTMDFDGNWGVFALFPSRNVILSDISRGLFVCDPSEAIGLGAPITSADWGNTVVDDTNVLQLREIDAQRMLVKPAPRSNKIEFTLGFTSTYNPLSTFDVTIRGAGSGQLKVYMRSASNPSNWVEVYTNTLTRAHTTFNINGLSSSAYRNASKEYFMKVVINGGELATTGINASLDMIRLKVR